MRQQLESGILWNATNIRKQHSNTSQPPLGIKASGFSDIRIERNIWQAIDYFVVDMKRNDPGNAVFISYTNGGVHYLNSQIRNNYYGTKDAPLQQGDLLMVVQNNYLYELVNGHHIKLVKFNPQAIRQGSLQFVSATIQIPETGINLDVMIIKELLFRKEPSLTRAEENDLMKYFAIRMKQNGIKPKTEEYMKNFRNDRYVNALRVKFGYSVTCHKAQGGEWPRVYLNLEPMLENIPRPTLYRWVYTAITRARNQLVIPNHKYIY
nr:ATP-binding domain-containing protein [Bacteroidota bacterium]